MRFRPIADYRPDLARSECIGNLVSDFGVKEWALFPSSVSELERVLVFGKAVHRHQSEFTNRSWLGYPWHIIDHAYVFRCESGMTFAMTMPYDTRDGFYRKFGEMMRDYYEHKDELARRVEDPKTRPFFKRYDTAGWRKQLAIEQTITALVVDDRYKVRENGHFAAIIATSEAIEALREMMPA